MHSALETVSLYWVIFSVASSPVFCCPCWKWLWTCISWRRSLLKIFAQQHVEIMRHSNIAVLVTHNTLNGKIIFFTAKPPLSNQDKAMENCTRLKVTTYLYRGPIINARSLSTFISGIVSNAPTNSVDVDMDASRRWTQWFECSEKHMHSLDVT